MKLHNVQGKNSYCGPAAMSTITGLPTEECARQVRRVNPQVRMVKGLQVDHLVNTLREIGVSYQREDWVQMVAALTGKKITLAQFLRNKDRDPKAIYIVLLTGHYVVVKGRKAIDNHFKTPTWIRKFHFRRKRVNRVYRITKIDKKKIKECVKL